MARNRRIPALTLELLPGWNKLEEFEQTTVRSESRALGEALDTAGNSLLAVGEHLVRLREVLGARHHHGMWEKMVKMRPYGLSRATINRRIRNYELARTILPKPVMQMAMMRGMDTINAKMVASIPPPKVLDHGRIGKYLDRIQQPGKIALVESSPEDELRRTYNAVRLAYQKIGNRARLGFLRSLIGMLMTLGGLEAQTFEPMPVPEDFVIPRGRPSLKKAA